MKTHKDRLLPGDESGNYKMWAACDLATGLLISKTTNYELKEYPRVNNILGCSKEFGQRLPSNIGLLLRKL